MAEEAYWDQPPADQPASTTVDDFGPEPSKDYTREELLALWGRFLAEGEFPARAEAVADQYPDRRSLIIDYWAIDRFDDDFAGYILEAPDRSIRMAEVAIRDRLPPDVKVPIHVRLVNLPERVKIRALRPEHLGALIAVDGIVRKVIEVRPHLETGLFQCKMCEAVMRVEQGLGSIKEPVECSKDAEVYVGEPGCGRPFTKTRFRLLQRESVFIAAQKIEMQETPESMTGNSQPERMTVWLHDDIVGVLMPGDRVVMNGTLRATPRRKGKEPQTEFDIHLYANSYEVMETMYEDIKISEEELATITELSRSPNIHSILTHAVAPSLWGLIPEKRAVLFQLFGGVTKHLPDGARLRGDIHILMVGDPGTAKSQLLRYIAKLAPRGLYTSGKSATGVGLTAAAVRDDFGDGRWTLEAGTLVLADRGLAVVDELDKMRENDRSSLHEAAEQQTISVAKAGINAVLNARCSILAAANPKLGKFDAYTPISEQVTISSTLLTRFDLILIIRDLPDKARDEDMGRHILSSHQYRDGDEDAPQTPTIAPDLLRKYIAHARTNVQPRLTDEASEALLEFYTSMRSGAESVGITPRYLEGLVRLTEASARIRLSGEATREDAGMAIELMERSLRMATRGDIDNLEVGIPSSQRDVLHLIQEVLRERGHPLTTDELEGEIPQSDRQGLEKGLEVLHGRGIIYSPKDGVWVVTAR